MLTDFTIEDFREVIQEEILKVTATSTNLAVLLTRKEASEYLKVKENTLAVWAVKGIGPAPTKNGSRSMYKRSFLDQFIDENTMPR